MKLKKYTFRKFFNDIHLWLGVGSGLILFVVCLSGTILAFQHEIEGMFDSDKHQVQHNQSKLIQVDTLIANVEKETGGEATAIRIMEDESQAYQVFVKTSPKERPAMVLVNQYSGEVNGKVEGSASGFFGFMMKLHRWLLLDVEIGRPIVGISTIIFVFLCLTGLVLWIPKKIKHIKKGLTIKAKSGWKRTNYDLHNVLGFYALPLLLIMALTGLNWSFEWYKDGMSKVINDQVFKQRKEKPLLSDQHETDDVIPISVFESIKIADAQLPYGGNRHIVFPASPEEAIQVRKSKTGFFALAASDRVHLDRFSGAVLKVDRFEELPLNQKINALMKPLHLGDVFGLFSKILYFIACLIATSLPITGVIVWINKLRKKAKKKKKPLRKQKARPVLSPETNLVDTGRAF